MTSKILMAVMATGLVAGGALGSSHAAADTLVLSGGTCGVTIPGGSAANNFLGDTDYSGYFGASALTGCINQSLSVTEAAAVSAAWFGAEAGYRNRFVWNGVTTFSHGGGTQLAGTPGAPLATAALGLVDAGELLPFLFRINGGATTVGNGGGDAYRSIFYGIDGNDANSVWLWLDDSGAGPDDDYDDMLVKLTVRAVPEPGTLGLLGLGLLATAFARRRR